MELRHLQSFLILAEELHFGRAAERVGIAQPALSRQIQQLEAEVGVPLFNRTPRSVTLTQAGEELRARVRQHVDGIDLALTACRAMGSGHSGRLKIGFTSNLSYALLPRVLSRLKEIAPDASFDVHEMSTDPQIAALRTGELDLAMVVLPISDGSLMQRHLFKDPLVLVMPTNHPLATRESVSLAQLQEYPFVMCPRYRRTGFQHSILERCADVGFVPNVVQEVEGKTLMYELIARGVGISVVPESSNHGHRAGVTYRPIVDGPKPVEMGAVWRKESDSALRRVFVDTAVAAARELYAPKRVPAVA